MKAFKIWNNEKNYIHKDTTDELNIKWTTNIDEALDTDDIAQDRTDLSGYAKAVWFFHHELGFSLNTSKPDPLYYS